MNYSKLIMGIGAWVAILPLLGFPTNLRQIIFGVTGVLLILIGSNLRKQLPKEAKPGEEKSEYSDTLEGTQAKVEEPKIVKPKDEPTKVTEVDMPTQIEPVQSQGSVINKDFLNRISD